MRCIWCTMLIGLMGFGSALADDGTRTPINVFEGRVLDHAGQPVEGARIGIADAERGFVSVHAAGIYTYAPEERLLLFFKKRNGRRAGETMTGADGRFSFRNLAYGDYALVAHHNDKGVAVIGELGFTKDATEHDIVLQPPVRIKGKLAGIDDATMVVFQPTGLPENVYLQDVVNLGEDGAFESNALPEAEEWSVMAQTYVTEQRYPAVLFSATRKLKAGETAEYNLDFNSGTKLEGSVVGPQGEALSGVSVVAKGQDGIAVGAVTDGRGKYTIRGLQNGSYTLTGLRHAIRTAPG